MLDAFFRRHAEGYLAPLAARLAEARVRANALTLGSFVFGAAAVLAIAHRDYLVGLGFLVAARLLDMLDGPVARRGQATAFGAYLDTVLDLTLSAAVPFAFALALPDRSLAAMFWMLGLVARAGAAGIGGARAGLAQAGLLIGKSELFIAFTLACLFPDRFSLIAYIVGIACFVAAGSRVAAAAVAAP